MRETLLCGLRPTDQRLCQRQASTRDDNKSTLQTFNTIAPTR